MGLGLIACRAPVFDDKMNDELGGLAVQNIFKHRQNAIRQEEAKAAVIVVRFFERSAGLDKINHCGTAVFRLEELAFNEDFIAANVVVVCGKFRGDANLRALGLDAGFREKVIVCHDV